MAQAILLVGGFGTRLLPLTRTVPKPMLPIAGIPVTEHQLMMAKRAGITDLVLATSYLSEIFIPYFGDGSHWGMKLQYAIEDQPLGTGGAIRNAACLLNGHESIVIFNGDILTSHDLSRQIAMHESLDADVTMHLTTVSDPRAYGCVPLDDGGRVKAFHEKMENPVANTVNAGCYVFHPRVLDEIPLGKVVSIEREIFPALVDQRRAIFGMVDDSYWLDIGTPAALLKGSRDVVQGIASGHALDSVSTEHWSLDYIAIAGAIVEPGARITGGSAIGPGAHVSAGAVIDGSIISEGAKILSGAHIHNSFIGADTTVSGALTLRNSYISHGEITSLMPL